MITLRAPFRKVIADPPPTRRKVVVALGRKALRQRDHIGSLVRLASEADVAVIVGTDDPDACALQDDLRARLPGRLVVAVLTQVAAVDDDPEHQEIVELPAIKLLLAAGMLVVCAGGPRGVIDGDVAGELLARTLGADDLLLLTDVPAVQFEWGTSTARTVHRVTPQELRAHVFAADSIGPKIEAACSFVERTGGTAAIGALHDAAEILAGNAGTIVRRDLY